MRRKADLDVGKVHFNATGAFLRCWQQQSNAITPCTLYTRTLQTDKIVLKCLLAFFTGLKFVNVSGMLVRMKNRLYFLLNAKPMINLRYFVHNFMKQYFVWWPKTRAEFQ